MTRPPLPYQRLLIDLEVRQISVRVPRTVHPDRSAALGRSGIRARKGCEGRALQLS